MKTILIDSHEKVIGVIGAYLLSLVVWAGLYIGQLALMIFLIIDGPPRTPTEMAFLSWWWIYPIAVVFGMIFGLPSYGLKLKRVATISFFFPLVVAVLLAIPVISTEMQTRQAEQNWFDAYWDDPPREISDLDLSKVGFGGISHNPDFENIYLLPEDVSASDIIYWDGATLVFETEKSYDEMRQAYLDAYQIMGLESGYSSGSGDGYDSIGFRDYVSGKEVNTEILFSTRPAQEITTISILTCSRGVDSCLRQEYIFWCVNGNNVGNFNCDSVLDS